MIIRIYVNKQTKRENEHIFIIIHFYLKRLLKSSIFFDRTTAIFYACVQSAMKTLNYLKNAVYERKPATIDDLMNFITEEAHKITTDMCQKVIQCFHRRQHTCIKNGGSSVEKY